MHEEITMNGMKNTDDVSGTGCDAGRGRARETYSKPEIVRNSNLREITRECPEWQCSVVVPPPPNP